MLRAMLIAAVSFMVLFALPASLYQCAKIRRQAGPLLLKVLRPTQRRWCLALFLLYGAGAVGKWVAVCSAWMSSTHGGDLDVFVAVAWTLGALASLAAARFAYVEIRGEGVIEQAGLLPWSQLKHYSWKDGAEPTLCLQFTRYATQWRIAGSQRESVQRLLREHLPAVGAEGGPSTLRRNA